MNSIYLRNLCYALFVVIFSFSIVSISAEKTSSIWVSRVIEVAKGNITKKQNGEAAQVRYKGWTTQDFSQYPNHSYKDTVKNVSIKKVAMPDIKGDVSTGKKIWGNSPCINCHVNSDDDRWAGNIGPSLVNYGARDVKEDITYQIIYDPRVIFPNTMMPPWGSSGVLSAEEIVHLTTYLHSLKTPIQKNKDSQWHPVTRDKPETYLGDNLDEMSNPAVIFAEIADDLWSEVGSNKQSCASCHEGELMSVMKGVATKFPKYMEKYQRVVSIEDFLSAHSPETTGTEMPVQSENNIFMAMRIKMASNGMPISIDLKDKNNMAAWEKGKKTFYKRVGQRNHSCADCHSRERIDLKWLGGRYISRADASKGIAHTWPAWRTSFGEVWTIRKRFQWCMLPHGANNLSADAEEYADMELYLTAITNGKNLNVPGLKD